MYGEKHPALSAEHSNDMAKLQCHSFTYKVDGKNFVVTPVFHKNGKETLGSVLLKLMETESV